VLPTPVDDRALEECERRAGGVGGVQPLDGRAGVELPDAGTGRRSEGSGHGGHGRIGPDGEQGEGADGGGCPEVEHRQRRRAVVQDLIVHDLMVRMRCDSDRQDFR